jgi:hypothetical protein
MSATLNRPSTRNEILLGRTLALCIHPCAAWRTQSTSGRLLVFFAYLAASYTLVLGLLLLSRMTF